MRLPDIFKAHARTFSFEFFPPKTEQAEANLMTRAAELAELRPAFVSVTYGAGGSTRDKTRRVISDLKDRFGLDAAAHLTCVGHSREELIQILEGFDAQGVDNIVALWGDPPADQRDFVPHPDGLRYAAELVDLIRTRFGDRFGIAVAGYPEGHPETASKLKDLDHLKAKVDAGADAVVTQLFFDNRDFHDFAERCTLAGIDVPIVAGVMPIVSRKGVLRMADLCGARLPADLLRRLDGTTDDDHVAQVGIDWATAQCRDLLAQGTPGIHFYTLNRSGATTEIYRRLGAANSLTLERMAEPPAG